MWSREARELSKNIIQLGAARLEEVWHGERGTFCRSRRTCCDVLGADGW